jgi:protein-disulfide isomerase
MRLPHWLCLALTAVGCGGSSSSTGPVLVPVPVGSSPVRGPADAWVTMIEFADFQCSYCGAEEPIVESLLEQFPVDLRLVFKNFPIPSVHPDAEAAAIAAECANEQGLFWPMHDLLYAHQDALDTASLQTYAQDAGVSLAPWQTCLNSAAPVDVINSDVALGESFGVNGTPTFFINGEMVVGAAPEAQLQGTIQTARASAEDSGVPSSAYYDQVILGQ